MYRRTRVMMITAGCMAALGAMLLIPGGDRGTVADAAVVEDVTSQETIAAIDAMLGPKDDAPQQVASVASGFAAHPLNTSEPDPTNIQTAALTTPQPEIPAIDPSLRPDSIGPSAVNLRAGPSSSSATVAVLQPGQALHAGAAEGGWVQVTLDDGTTGFVYSRYLASVTATASAEPTAADTTTAKATIKGDTSGALEGRTARIEASIAARAKPDGGSRTVFRTEPGERVRILDVRGGWLHIRTADGSSGWIEAG